ncbi:pectin lyase fold/virulence factor [Infundibulicybe gibba]|nr:pectin lyase fold/virulence factor [Infundibulicybe gibba]
MLLFASLAFVLSICQAVIAASRTTPPSGAIVVRAGTKTAGEFASIYGYTADTSSYTGNQVTIQAGVGASTTINDDASGTLRVHKDNSNCTTQYGTRAGFYGCGFYVEQGTQVFLKGYIQGATDFIFGQRGFAYFGGNTLAVSGPGYVTASGRSTNDASSYVFNQNTIVLASGAASNTAGNVYLGRPWSNFAKYGLRVIFKNTQVTAPLNKALWSIWSTATPNTDNAFFADYNTVGSGVSGVSRASFATLLTASQAAAYSISSALGSDYATWVDTAYVV